MDHTSSLWLVAFKLALAGFVALALGNLIPPFEHIGATLGGALLLGGSLLAALLCPPRTNEARLVATLRREAFKTRSVPISAQHGTSEQRRSSPSAIPEA